MEHGQLDLLRHGGGKALDIQLLRVQAHGLHKQLMPGLVREAGDLCLNGGTVPGPNALNDAAVHGGTVQILPDDPVGLLVGVGEPADGPVHRRGLRFKGEGHGLGVPVLPLHFGKIHAAGVDPGRGAGFEPPEGEAHVHQTVRQR